jgi:uncharacterized protein YkwD/LysM repeat protein
MIKTMRCKKLFRLSSLLILCILLGGTGIKQAHAISHPAKPSSQADTVIRLINQMRVANGLEALTPNPILMQVAQAHSEYQAATGTITHYSADGMRPFQRALAAGYWIAGDLSRNGFYSENIIGGPGLTPERAVEAWMGDEPHMNTMMSPNYQDIGAGVASDGESSYFTVDTAKPSNVPVAYTPEAQVVSSGSGYIIPVKVATPWMDGSIYHDVQSGQSLWAVSEAYGVDVDEIARLNGRQGNGNIYIGESLLIRPAFTLTPLLPTDTSPSKTATLQSAAMTVTPKLEETPEVLQEEHSFGFWVVLPVVLIALVVFVSIVRMGMKTPNQPGTPRR